MSRALLALAAFAALSSGSFAYTPSHPAPLRHAASIYVPGEILRGIALAESGGHPSALSRDKCDRGLYQLRKTYDAERSRKWGKFDPFDPEQAKHIAAHILAEAYRELGTWDKAITAYHRGIRWTRAHGLDRSYLRRVKG